jgi:hypothetical protein
VQVAADMKYRCLVLKSPLLGFALLGSLACSAPHDRVDDGAKGPVAHDANEAWPTRPADVPVLRVDDIANACATAGLCAPEVMELEPQTRAALVDLCVSDVIFSAERAIPMSGFRQSNERAEFWVRCVLDNAGQCSQVSQCKTERAPSIYCEEDGCLASEKLAASCNGNVATLANAEGNWTRDCSRSFATCDPNSATGCTDRELSRCPEDAARADRCDGNIRLGCDGKNQVSYRDCTRLGGACGTATDGSEDCLYAPQDAECPKSAECNGTTLSVCIQGHHLSFDSPLCAAP